MDSFEDLKAPPSSVVAVMKNRWLSNGFKEGALQVRRTQFIPQINKKSQLEHSRSLFFCFFPQLDGCVVCDSRQEEAVEER